MIRAGTMRVMFDLITDALPGSLTPLRHGVVLAHTESKFDLKKLSVQHHVLDPGRRNFKFAKKKESAERDGGSRVNRELDVSLDLLKIDVHHPVIG